MLSQDLIHLDLLIHAGLESREVWAVGTTKLPKPHELSQPWILAASWFESLIFREPKVLKSLCFAAVLSGQSMRIFQTEGNP